MISISPQALAIIRERKQPIHLDLPPVVTGGCCLPSIRECPVIRFGPPRSSPRKHYSVQSIDGITVHVPRGMPEEGNFTITVSSFLGIKRVVLEGWRLL